MKSYVGNVAKKCSVKKAPTGVDYNILECNLLTSLSTK